MDIFNVVIGTAGHIDHGKSSLVQNLTGIHPDRLKEEKERGLTIDLGFAPLELPNGKKIGIIDVPGHEKFIKNMVAGASGIDYVILVIAADDGVMQQTREHLEIMQLLGISKGMVAISKIDLVDEELLELIEEDIMEFLQGTFLENAKICKISTTTNKGWEFFKKTLFQEIENIVPKSHQGVFRMPIQRVFSRHGYGTVATGIPIAGNINIGDDVEILPKGIKTKIKKIHAYGEEISCAKAGHSTALNLKDVNYQKIKRGDVIAFPGYLKAVSFVEGKFLYLKNQKRHLKHMTPIRFHCGTTEIMGKVSVLGQESLAPGEEGFIQLRLEEKVVVAPGDTFVVRLSSPKITIGGGIIIDSGDKKLKRFRANLKNLQEKSTSLESEKQLIEMRLTTEGICREDELKKKCLLDQKTFENLIKELLQANKIEKLNATPARYVHINTLEEQCQIIERIINSYFKKNKYKLYISILDLRNLTRIEAFVLDFFLEKMEEKKITKRLQNKITLKNRNLKLKPDEINYKKEIENSFSKNHFSPLSKTDILKTSSLKNKDAIFELLIEEEKIIAINKDIFFHTNTIEEAKNIIISTIDKEGFIISAEFRDKIQTSRKFAIPLLDYFDKIGLTIREENKRVLKK